MSTMQQPIVTYPQPPPTYNALTSSQRQRLLRTTKKLGKVLGTTPQLMDCNYTVFLDLAMSPTSRPLSPISIKSTSSTRSTLSRYAASVNESLTNYAASSTESHHDLGPINRKSPPILRLVDSSTPNYNDPFSEKMPGSPRSHVSSQSFSSVLSSTSSTDHHSKTLSSSRSYTISVPHKSNPHTHRDGDPEFRLASEASSRRRKVERVRKRLGECVPIEAIFSAKEKSESKTDDRSKFVGNGTALEVVHECLDERSEDSFLLRPRLRQPCSKTSLRKWFRRKTPL